MSPHDIALPFSSKKSGQKISMGIALFPGVVGRIVFRLDLMDGSLLFPPLTTLLQPVVLQLAAWQNLLAERCAALEWASLDVQEG